MSSGVTSQTGEPAGAPAGATGAAPGTEPTPDLVASSLRHCHRLTRENARNFYYGLKLTPEPKRSALYAIYAFMRMADDLVDGDMSRTREDAGAALERLGEFRRTLDRALEAAADELVPDGEPWHGLRYVVRRYGVNPRHLHLMLDGQRMDLVQRRYATFNELYGYCYRVASVVGFACLDVWGHDGNPGVAQLAEYRGIAFQLTNILRDVVEDARCDRVYLPQEDLQRFGVTDAQLAAAEPSHGLERLMKYQAERARSYYEMSASLERHLEADCRPTSWVMTQIYRGLLERISANPASVLRGRVKLSPVRKLTIAARATLKRNWG